MDHNGQPKITINVTQLADDWVIFNAGDTPPNIDELPQWLNRSMVDWLREHSASRPRAVLPIVANGNTVAIHLWYDE